MKATYTPVIQGDPNPHFNGKLIDTHGKRGLSYGVKVLNKATFRDVLELRCYMPVRNVTAAALWLRMPGNEASATATEKADDWSGESDAFRQAAEKCGFVFPRDEWDNLTNHEVLKAGCLAICVAAGYAESEIVLVPFYPR